MIFADPTAPVRCVEGCGGGGESTTLGIVGLLVAILSLAIALKAWRVSDSSLSIANAQHQEFLKDLRARADFDLELHLEGHPDWIVETDEPQISLEWRTVINNSGSKAAADVGVNLLAPSDLYDLRSDGKYATKPSTQIEELKASDGTSYPAQYLVELIDRFSLRMVQMKFVYATVDTPETPGEERVVPLVFRVWSADLPDDIELRAIEAEVRIRRTA